jgi:hypothetical protein
MVEDKRVAIVQSNYVPWRGYFDLIASVDEFILLDDAQYTRRDWRNRNRIKTPTGSRWLTIAVEVSGRFTQSIYDTRVADPQWPERHWDVLRQYYSPARGFSDSGGFVEELYAGVASTSLTDINRHFLHRIAAHLGIHTPLTVSLDYQPRGTRTARLVDLCVKTGATEYVSGPAARAYLDEDCFRKRDIAVSWFQYGPYADYDQIYPPFDPRVSILDLLLCAGSDARRLIEAQKQQDHD